MCNNSDSAYFPLQAGEGKWTVSAKTQRLGKDILVAFIGGHAPHIGAAALAVPRPGISDPEKVSASASVLCKTGHKDDELSREAALRIAAACNTTVCVTVGIHIDDATSDDIEQFAQNFFYLVDRVIELLSDEATQSRQLP